MKIISKSINAVLFRLTNTIAKSKNLSSLSDKFKTGRLLPRYEDDSVTNQTLKIPRVKYKHKTRSFVRFARVAGYSIFILFSANSFITATVHADANMDSLSIVKTFRGLDPEHHQEFTSDIYEVWVKPILHQSTDVVELDGKPNIMYPFNPEAKDFKKSFTYKSVNDIATNDTDDHSKCYQYYYDHPNPPKDAEGLVTDSIQYRSESIPDDPENKGYHCDVTKGDPQSTRRNFYQAAYEVMTHSNNWTTFDVGYENGNSHLGAVRIYIQLNTGYSENIKEITHDIRPNHTVTKDPLYVLGNNNKYIKVMVLGEEYVRSGSNLHLKKVLVLDVLQPQGTNWSGQFYVGFKDAEITRDIFNPYNKSINYKNEKLDDHPLFIFANPLPDWYHILADKSKYDGCPVTQTELLLPNSDLNRLPPNRFYTHPNWELDTGEGNKYGKVVDTVTYLDKNGELKVEFSGIREVNDFILKSYSKRLCIPGGVYVKGRIIHNNKYHTDNGLKLKIGDPNLSPGDTGVYDEDEKQYNNAKGVKIVGRGILSGIDVKYRTNKKSIPVEECTTCPCEVYPTGGGWDGHLIDIRHRGNAYIYTNKNGKKFDYTADVVIDNNGKELDCYYRHTGLQKQDVNCVQGITMVDSPKASIFTNGSRMDVENVKIMSWHIETNGIGSGVGSKIKNVFIKVNDDSIVMGKSDMKIDNATVWRQRWGSVVNLSWKLAGHNTNKKLKFKDIDPIEDSELNGLNVIRFEPIPQKVLNGNTVANNNAAIVTARNLMGGTIQGFSFKNIVVEDPLYEIINLQLDDKNTYKSTKRNLEQDQLDGIGNIKDITFDGLFTKGQHMIMPYSEASHSDQGEVNAMPIQKSVFSTYDEMFDKDYAQKCTDKCELNCGDDSVGKALCQAKCDNVKQFIGNDLNKIQRSISDVKLKNICINDGKAITHHNINEYFVFENGTNYDLPYGKEKEDLTQKEKDDYKPKPGNGSSFEEISGEDTANTIDICGSLDGVGMCTLENYRNYCQ